MKRTTSFLMNQLQMKKSHLLVTMKGMSIVLMIDDEVEED